MAFLSLLLVALHACQKHEFKTVALQHEFKTEVWKWDMDCLQQDTRDTYLRCWRCMHVRRMCLKQLHFSTRVRGKFWNETQVVYNRILETLRHFRVQYPSSLAPAWHEALGHCSPVALVACAACMSEEGVHTSCSLSQRLTNSFQHFSRTEEWKWDMNCQNNKQETQIGIFEFKTSAQ